jgi:putative NADH-flavin reductase
VPFLETIRKIILAVKTAAVSYFIMVGGTGSLHIPDRKDPHETAVDNPDFWIAYRRALADSEAHTVYMEERLGPLGRDLRRYRNARIAMKQNNKDNVSAEDRQFVVDYEAKVRGNDDALTFIRAGRTSYLFFDGNTSFRWTYVSPSARYRPGRRTGRYETMVDELPLLSSEAAAESSISTDSNPLEGRLLGISAPDLAIAIAEEAENQRFVGRHWTAYGDLSDDAPGVIYARLGEADHRGYP